ncbi:MAG: transcriptional regulator [Desulfatitalea sp.]|nr:transcriptional regulator [Desulfatitalea sp.]NNK00415.1 transcriptional regulator [Desulfatitalea sp.]
MARGDQLSRQWKLIQSLIASVKGRSAGDLAQELACHSRTVYRDLEALQAAGFPLFTQHDGGRTFWSIVGAERFRMPLPLNLTELMALYFSRNMLKLLDGTAIYEALSTLFEKITATLPPAYVEYLDQLALSLEVGVKPRKPYADFQETLDRISRAVQAQRLVSMDYFSMGRQTHTHRRVAPYKVWFYDETFYLIGFCHVRQAVRLFAVDRIARLVLLEESFDWPKDFDATRFMADSFGVFQGDPVLVRIRFKAETAGYVREKQWHPSQALEEMPDGGVVFSARVAGIEEIKHWVLRWGAGAQVLAPDALRRAVAEEVARMADFYSEACPPFNPSCLDG